MLVRRSSEVCSVSSPFVAAFLSFPKKKDLVATLFWISLNMSRAATLSLSHVHMRKISWNPLSLSILDLRNFISRLLL